MGGRSTRGRYVGRLKYDYGTVWYSGRGLKWHILVRRFESNVKSWQYCVLSAYDKHQLFTQRSIAKA